MKRTMMIVLATALASSLGCANDEHSDDALRMLPVAAIAQDGREVLVGSYDQESGELTLDTELVDPVVDTVEADDGSLKLVFDDEAHPLAPSVEWEALLDEGSILDIVITRGEESEIGGQLVVHDESWTEAEAASVFRSDDCIITSEGAIWCK